LLTVSGLGKRACHFLPLDTPDRPPEISPPDSRARGSPTPSRRYLPLMPDGDPSGQLNPSPLASPNHDIERRPVVAPPRYVRSASRGHPEGAEYLHSQGVCCPSGRVHQKNCDIILIRRYSMHLVRCCWIPNRRQHGALNIVGALWNSMGSKGQGYNNGKRHREVVQRPEGFRLHQS
jgi:hypothetical protein